MEDEAAAGPAVAADLLIGFPGQGGDWRAAIATLAANPGHPLVLALADRLGTDRWPDLDPLDTRCTQPVVYVAGLVGPAAQRGPDDVVAVAGHSLGEITASAWAGAIDPLDGLDLVGHRAALGHQEQSQRPGAMVAVMRLDEAQVEWWRRLVVAETGGVLDVAVVNSASQIVLSGDVRAVDRVAELVDGNAGVAHKLPIGGAYHSPLMVEAVDGFRAQVARAVQRDPRVPVVSSTVGRALRTSAELVDGLARALVLPVRWPDAVDAAVALGARRAIDAGPGDTLVRLSRFLPALPFTPA